MPVWLQVMFAAIGASVPVSVLVLFVLRSIVRDEVQSVVNGKLDRADVKNTKILDELERLRRARAERDASIEARLARGSAVMEGLDRRLGRIESDRR